MVLGSPEVLGNPARFAIFINFGIHGGFAIPWTNRFLFQDNLWCTIFFLKNCERINFLVSYSFIRLVFIPWTNRILFLGRPGRFFIPCRNRFIFQDNFCCMTSFELNNFERINFSELLGTPGRFDAKKKLIISIIWYDYRRKKWQLLIRNLEEIQNVTAIGEKKIWPMEFVPGRTVTWCMYSNSSY